LNQERPARLRDVGLRLFGYVIGLFVSVLGIAMIVPMLVD